MVILFATLAAYAQPPALPADAGQSLSLAKDDFQLKLETSHEWSVAIPEAALGRQIVLAFRARIDNTSTMGSSNGVFIEVNGRRVGLSTPRRQVRLLNKPNRFRWTNPPWLAWYLPDGAWRLSYAPDFEILLDREYYGPEAYEFEFDLSDMLVAGENTLSFRHAANKAIAAHAGSDMTLYFRDLRLDVREGPGALPGEPERADYSGPFEPRESRTAEMTVSGSGAMTIEVRGHRYELTSRYSAPGPDGAIEWRDLRGDELAGDGWALRRGITDRCADGRLLISDIFTNTSDGPVGIRVRHELKLDEGRVEVVNFGGREDPDITRLNRPSAPWVFLPREDHGIALVAADDVLRQHAALTWDDSTLTAGISDDWFGLAPGESYTMAWGVYATDTANVFDLVNMVREDWLEPFTIEGGINFFDPDAILAYDDEALRAHLEMLNINVMMSQGGWVDRKLLTAGRKNLGHGPIVMSDLYADYRARLRAACEKLRRLRPGVKCLIYLDTWIVTGDDLQAKWGDSLWTRRDGRPLQNSYSEAWDTHLALVTPTLENAVGRELLEKIPSVYLDEIGADGMYWDEMSRAFGVRGWVSGSPDYAHADGHTFEISDATGEIVAECGAAELASLPFKQALLNAFLDRGATVVANTTPTTLTETSDQFVRFNETSIGHHPGTIYKSWTYTPVSYAGYSVYHTPGVTEEMFLADIRDKVWNANLYLFSSHIFYPLFTHENLATYQYPITPIELDWGVIIGRERIVTIRPGRFGWPGERWSGEVVYFDKDQRVRATKQVTAGDDGYVDIGFDADEAAVIVRDDH
jgi:hypothetical protein